MRPDDSCPALRDELAHSRWSKCSKLAARRSPLAARRSPLGAGLGPKSDVSRMIEAIRVFEPSGSIPDFRSLSDVRAVLQVETPDLDMRPLVAAEAKPQLRVGAEAALHRDALVPVPGNRTTGSDSKCDGQRCLRASLV